MVAVKRTEGVRVRRTKAEARAEIVSAARDVLASEGPAGLSVAAIMARTGMTRKAFYVHFTDRTDLIRSLVRPLRAELDDAMLRWREHDDPSVAGFAALDQAVQTYVTHNAILRALWWTSVDDPEIDAIRTELGSPLIETASAILARDRGFDAPSARAVATALATMNVHSLLALGSTPPPQQVADTVGALRTVWLAVAGPRRDQGPTPPMGSGKS